MESKKAFRDKMRNRMAEWERKITVLKARAKEADEELRIKYNQKIHEIETNLLILKQRLRDLDSSSGDSWRQISGILEKAATDFKQTLDKAGGSFKSKNQS